MEQNPPNSNCYNCNQPIQADDIYCGNCGQKHHKGKYSIGKLITDFIEANFNLDGRIFRSIGGLLRPGFLTKQYFAGKHKSYNTPIQIFLVIAVIFFSIVGSSLQFDNNGGGLKLRERLEKNKLSNLKDSLVTEIAARNLDPNLQLYLDSLISSAAIINDSILIDTIKVEDALTITGEEALTDISFVGDSLKWGGISIPVIEMLDTPAQDIIDKYIPDKPWYQKVLFRQGLRLGLDQSQIISFLFSRLPLMILFVTPFFALLLKLLYWRRGFYFIEHFVFTLHLNSAGLFLALLVAGISYLTIDYEVWMAVAFLFWLLYFFLAMKRFYAQGWGKTILKYILALMLGMVVAIIASLFIFGLAFLIF